MVQVFQQVWEEDSVPCEWKDALTVTTGMELRLLNVGGKPYDEDYPVQPSRCGIEEILLDTRHWFQRGTESVVD